MYKLFILFASLSVNMFVQVNAQTYINPVIPGDFPDPTVIRVGEDYYAAATTSDYAPAYPILHSHDLVNWNRVGVIFDTPPEWTKGDFWAPELYYNNEIYYVYYTARRKSDNVSCIGVATTRDIAKGFTDHGILIEWGSEAIDAFVFKDDDGKLYISWKAYGLDHHRPIEILASELSADGLSLQGEPFTLTPHDNGWKGHGDEGQAIIKRGKFYYLFYAIGGCCDDRCDYRVNVARSENLKEGWVQYNKNPILQGGELWKCSGHGTIVQTPDNRYFYLYHAYHNYDFGFVGRQGLLDEIIWDDENGWPLFRYGTTPSLQAEVPITGTIQKRETVFFDNFLSPENEKHWIWDTNLGKPLLEIKDGKLQFATPGEGICFRGVNPQTGNYTIETRVANQGANLKGLCIYGNSSNFFVWGVADGKIILHKVSGGITTQLFSKENDNKDIYLRIESVNGRLFRFLWSENPMDWYSYPDEGECIDGYFLPVWGRGVRNGLIVDNNEDNVGIFSYFSIENKY